MRLPRILDAIERLQAKAPAEREKGLETATPELWKLAEQRPQLKAAPAAAHSALRQAINARPTLRPSVRRCPILKRGTTRRSPQSGVTSTSVRKCRP